MDCARTVCSMKLRVLMMVALVFAISGLRHAEDQEGHPDASAQRHAGPERRHVFSGVSRAFEQGSGAARSPDDGLDDDTGFRVSSASRRARAPGFFNTGIRTMSGLHCRSVLAQRFVPKENYMVAPPQFATDPQYTGYRAGIERMVNGSWKFAYFVKD